MRVLFATTANDGHFGPLLPFVRACAASGHEVRVAAPASFSAALDRAGFPHEPFADVPPEVIGPIMARLGSLSVEEANDVVIREVFAGVDAQAALPSLLQTVQRWRPHLVVRESAEFASLAAAEDTGVPHVQVCIGMHELAVRMAEAATESLEQLGRLTGLADGRMTAALAGEPIFSLVPEILDYAAGVVPAGADAVRRFHEPLPPTSGNRPPDWGDPELPLVYVTFGSVTASVAPFAGVFREALDALADLEAAVLMTVGRKLDPTDLGPAPANARVLQWVPQEAVLAHAAAMLGHGGFGTTMGALAAGVPQVVVPLFALDQGLNGDRVAAVGAGVTTRLGTSDVQRGVAELRRLLQVGTYAESARRVAAALRELPPPAQAVPILAGLAG